MKSAEGRWTAKSDEMMTALPHRGVQEALRPMVVNAIGAILAEAEGRIIDFWDQPR